VAIAVQHQGQEGLPGPPGDLKGVRPAPLRAPRPSTLQPATLTLVETPTFRTCGNAFSVNNRTGRLARGVFKSSTEPATLPDGPITLLLSYDDVLYLTPAGSLEADRSLATARVRPRRQECQMRGLDRKGARRRQPSAPNGRRDTGERMADPAGGRLSGRSLVAHLCQGDDRPPWLPGGHSWHPQIGEVTLMHAAIDAAWSATTPWPILTSSATRGSVTW